jgi:hypothetical protein
MAVLRRYILRAYFCRWKFRMYFFTCLGLTMELWKCNRTDGSRFQCRALTISKLYRSFTRNILHKLVQLNVYNYKVVQATGKWSILDACASAHLYPLCRLKTVSGNVAERGGGGGEGHAGTFPRAPSSPKQRRPLKFLDTGLLNWENES